MYVVDGCRSLVAEVHCVRRGEGDRVGQAAEDRYPEQHQHGQGKGREGQRLRLGEESRLARPIVDVRLSLRRTTKNVAHCRTLEAAQIMARIGPGGGS